MRTITNITASFRSLGVVVCATALLAGCSGPDSSEPSATPSGGPPDIAASISARESYAAGGPVAIEFVLQNRGGEAVSVLVWNTPLEGLQGEMFRVTRGGEALPYQGMTVKRGDPGASEYRRIEAGKELAASVDLAGAYDLSAAGEYEVSLETTLADVAPASAALPRARDLHSSIDLRAGPFHFRIE